MDLFLFSIQCISTTKDKWDKNPILFFVDSNGNRYTKKLSDYTPYILIQPNNDSIEPMDIDSCLMDENRIKSTTLRIEEVYMTPLVGFTNNRKDRLFKLFYSKLSDRYTIMKTLETNLDITILHRSFSNEMLLLHITGWRLQKWYRVENGTGNHQTKCEDLKMIDGNDSLPPLSFVIVRLTVRSSTATTSNIFLPDHSIDSDIIECCDMTTGRIGLDTFEQHTLECGDERKMISMICEWFSVHDPCIVVHMSEPFDHLAYLYFRAKRIGIKSGLSVYGCSENMNVNDNTFRDLSCPGRELVDILHILQKFMITPNLDGYTLADAYEHPKLIRDKGPIQFDRDVEPILLPLHDRICYSRSEIQVMLALQQDNSFIINNMALSSSCDLSLFRIISRGQQTRAFSCFARSYHEQEVYINHQQFEKSYVIINKKRELSSFPDPPWIDNPPIETLVRKSLPIDTPSLLSPVRKKRRTVTDILGKRKPLSGAPKTKKRYGGGFVIMPEPGFYSDPRQAVVTLDFASLYPSIMQGYKRCFMSVCYDEKWLTDDRAEKEYVPLDDNTCCVFIKKYDGQPIRTVTDDIVYKVMKNRKDVRTKMKTVTDPFLLQSMDAQQLCCKVLQNAFYGACGSETFSIPCTAVAASICVIGQWMNKTVRHRGMLRGGRCVYGDTDSVMFQLPTDENLTTKDDILQDIYRQAKEMEEETTSIFPKPNAVEFEALKLPHLQTKMKKTYSAIEYPPESGGWQKQGHLLLKGFAIKKRDRCAFVQTIGKELISMLFRGTTDDDIRTWFLAKVSSTFTNNPTDQQLGDFIITCRLNTEYKQDNVLSLELADQYEKESGFRPRPGSRLRYVIAEFKYENRKHFQTAVTPTYFLKNKMKLDSAYYLGKQLLLPIKQVLDLKPKLYLKISRDIETHITSYMTNIRPISVKKK